MYDYIRGTLTELTPTKAIVEAGGLGYCVFIPLSAFSSQLSIGKEIKLHLSPIYREDSARLFGFLTRDERDIFERLSSISGIGPKTALSLIGHMSMKDLGSAISTSNAKLLAKVPGIGKKTAERVIIEMRDKIKSRPEATQVPLVTDEDHMIHDGINALMNLGYNNDRALTAIKKAIDSQGDTPKLEKVIKAALQLI